jgi:hypothetical protein
MLLLKDIDEELLNGNQALLLEGGQLLCMGSVDNEAYGDPGNPPDNDANAAATIADIFLTPHVPLLLMAPTNDRRKLGARALLLL